MGAFTKLAAEIFRQFVVDGVDTSGIYRPPKADIVTWGTELENLSGDFYSAAVNMAFDDLFTDADHKSIVVMPADGTSVTATVDIISNLRDGYAIAFHNPKSSPRFHTVNFGADQILLPPWRTVVIFRSGTDLLADRDPGRYRKNGVQLFAAPGGADTSDGLSSTYPKQTLKSACSFVYAQIDCMNGEPVLNTVGSFTDTVTLQGQLTGYNYLRITAANRGDTVWSADGGFCLLVGDNAEAILQRLMFNRGTNASAILIATHQPGVLDIDDCDFGDAGASAGTHASMDHGGSTMNFGLYSVSGDAGTHLQIGGACSGTQSGGVTIVISNNPSIGVWFSISGSGANHAMGSGVTYSGPIQAGCIKYLVSVNASASLSGNVPPGTIAGSATAGGQVIA